MRPAMAAAAFLCVFVVQTENEGSLGSSSPVFCGRAIRWECCPFHLRERLRGGEGKRSEAFRSFVDASGSKIDIGENGEVVGSKSPVINDLLKDKRQEGTLKKPSLKKRIGIERRKSKKAKLQAGIDGAIQSIPSEGRIVRQDPNWMPFLKAAEDAMPRETVLSKLQRQAAMQQTSDIGTARAAKRMIVTSRRKGRRTVKRMTARQQRSMEEAIEYKLSGKREQRAYEKDQGQRQWNAAYQAATENMEAMSPGTTASMKGKEKKLVRGLKVRPFNDDGRRLIDDGTGNKKLEMERMMQITKEVTAEWRKKRAEIIKQEEERQAYITSKDYLKKQKQVEKKKKRMALMRRKLADSKRSNKVKKQEKLLGVDRVKVNPDKVGFSSDAVAKKVKGDKKRKASGRALAKAEKKKNRKHKRP